VVEWSGLAKHWLVPHHEEKARCRNSREHENVWISEESLKRRHEVAHKGGSTGEAQLTHDDEEDVAGVFKGLSGLGILVLQIIVRENVAGDLVPFHTGDFLLFQIDFRYD